MAKVSNIRPFFSKWEGEFSDHVNDTGGPTMRGVTLATFIQYRKSKGLPYPTVTDLKNMSEVEWDNIISEYYWNPWQANFINNQGIANLLVGFAWGSGTQTSIKKLQTMSNGQLTVDGVVGPKTLQFINFQVSDILFDKIMLMLFNYHIDITSNRWANTVFLQGWFNRIYDNLPYCWDRQCNNNDILVPLAQRLSAADLKDIQKTIGVTADGKYGPQTQAALLRYPMSSTIKLADALFLLLKKMYVQQFISRSITANDLKSKIAEIYNPVTRMARFPKFE